MLMYKFDLSIVNLIFHYNAIIYSYLSAGCVGCAGYERAARGAAGAAGAAPRTAASRLRARKGARYHCPPHTAAAFASSYNKTNINTSALRVPSIYRKRVECLLGFPYK